MSLERETYREQARTVNGESAWAIRHCGGMYFAGFGGKPGTNLPSVKWDHSLAYAKLFNASALSQAEKYIERIKAKDPMYIGLHAVKVVLEGK